jgi:hypothetical protein
MSEAALARISWLPRDICPGWLGRGSWRLGRTGASGVGIDQEGVMPFIRTMHPRLVAGVIALLAVAGSVAVVATPGQAQRASKAQGAGATYVITPVGNESVAFTDVRPKGFRHNRFSLGDQLFLTTKIKRDGTVAGTAEATITVSDPHPLNGDKAHGVVSAVYHLADGDIYSSGTVLLDDSDTGEGAVTGGTGAYTGARGTIEPGHKRDIVHLLP